MTRTFAPDIEWCVLARDTFDRESPTTVDARGRGLASGLRELWRRVLSEGLRDSTSASFTSFSLSCGDSVDLGVQPFDNHAYAKLRRWIYGLPGPYESGGTRDPGQRESTILMDALVDTHARLLAREDKTRPGWQADSAAGLIRACVLACDDATQLVEHLAALQAR